MECASLPPDVIRTDERDMTEENHCLRCGALLPEGDEGICPACGTPFGRATQAMKVDPGALKRIADERRARNAAAAAPQMAAPVVAPEPSDNKPKIILIVVVVVAVALVVAIAFLR